MRRWIAGLAVGCAVLPGVGCLGLGTGMGGGGKYVDKRADGGVIAFREGEREAAVARVEKDYGDVRIDDEYEPAKQAARLAAETGQPTPPPARGDDAAWHIRFSKKERDAGGALAAPTPAAPVGANKPAADAAAPVGWDARPAAGAHGDDCRDCRK